MPLRFSASVVKPTAITADVLVLLTDDQLTLPTLWHKKFITRLKELQFNGQWGTAELLVAPAGMRAPLLAVIGLGERGSSIQTRQEGLRRGLGKIVQQGRTEGLRTMALVIDDNEDAPALTSAAVEAITLAWYQFAEFSLRLKIQQRTRALQEVIVLTSRSQLHGVRKTIRNTQRIMRGVTLARDLVNQPASHGSPRALVEAAEQIVRKSSLLSVQVMNRDQAAQQGFSAFLAVARGSQEEPYVIHLKYQPSFAKATAGTAKLRKIFIVGKGITFDSGGLSLKPASGMEYMKSDMAGAAAVLGLFAILPTLRPNVEVHGIIATCENMPSGNAYRPGDILTAKNGKTIEVLNTDAEGRLTLADALSYAVEHQPEAVIDLATLTGACIVALGETHAGLWSNNEQIQNQLLVAAEATGEGVVALPLPAEYRPFIESQIAEIRNTSTSRYGGAITAALFLQEFVGKTPWAHLDIAGPSYLERPILPYYGFGATGYGVRTLVEFLKNY